MFSLHLAIVYVFFFFNDTATTEIYTLSYTTLFRSETLIGRQQLKSWDGNPFTWPTDAIWPYWAEHLGLLDQALQPTTDGWLAHLRRNAFSILASLPEPPEQFRARLWDFAFGPKTERQQAAEALGRGRKISDRLLEEVASANPERRAMA